MLGDAMDKIMLSGEKLTRVKGTAVYLMSVMQ